MNWKNENAAMAPSEPISLPPASLWYEMKRTKSTKESSVNMQVTPMRKPMSSFDLDLRMTAVPPPAIAMIRNMVQMPEKDAAVLPSLAASLVAATAMQTMQEIALMH